MQADGAGEGQFAFAQQQGLTGLVKGDQGGGAGGVDGHTRPAQVEDIRQPIGGDAGGGTGSCIRSNGREVVGKAIAVVGAGQPNEYTGFTTA